MGTLTLLSASVMEAGTLATTPASTNTGRLADRDRTLQWTAFSAAQTDITLTLPLGQPISALALVHHNLGLPAIIELAGSNTGTFTTPFATITVNADPFFTTFASQAFKYYNVRIPAGVVAAKIGELMLGIPSVFSLPPFLDSAYPATLGNVRRDLSRAGHVWAVQQGPKRAQLAYRWTGLNNADLALLLAAYDDTQQGAKNLLVKDELDVVRWMSWDAPALRPVAQGAGLYAVNDCIFTETPP